jgi:hypothetical protein
MERGIVTLTVKPEEDGRNVKDINTKIGLNPSRGLILNAATGRQHFTNLLPIHAELAKQYYSLLSNNPRPLD